MEKSNIVEYQNLISKKEEWVGQKDGISITKDEWDILDMCLSNQKSNEELDLLDGDDGSVDYCNRTATDRYKLINTVMCKLRAMRTLKIVEERGPTVSIGLSLK